MQDFLGFLLLGVCAGCCLIGFWLLQGLSVFPLGGFWLLWRSSLSTPGLHSNSFALLWGEPEAPRARHSEKFKKNGKNKTTWELKWESFGTHFETFASQSRAGKRFEYLLRESFFDSVSRSVFKQVFRVKR